MKKIIIILAIVIGFLSINKYEQTIIPNESIRFRIIANSNSSIDQELKKQILTNLSTELVNTRKLDNISDTRKYIIKELPKFENIVEKTINENNYNKSFHINYGKNFFPEKKYKNVVYKEGEYESLVITIGDGEGDNFWCILFPPLCLVDEEHENTTYESITKKIVDKIIKKE